MSEGENASKTSSADKSKEKNVSEENIEVLLPPSHGLRRGKCKWFNVTKGWGFITPDDGSQDVFVHQSVLNMTGFRSLGEDEIVDFEAKESDKGVEATLVTGPNSANLRGSSYQRNNKKRYRKTRCYNCGEFANHIAADCTLEAQPKKCHHCKSSEHLMANCPVKTSKSTTTTQESKSNESDVPEDGAN